MGQLPSGTVTFLFTDIEGSTRLLRELRERYGALRDAHHRLLREAFAAADGHEMGTEGDAFFVAFRRAKDAVRAAVEAQRALVTYRWPDRAEFRVRMGIHTGEPDVDEEGYLGLALHQVARICAAAHGGQILVSSATREIVEHDLPSGVSLRDLGDHRLKDFDRPQPISQLDIEGLRTVFPPLRTAAPPSRLERLVRRERKREAPTRSVTEHPWYLRRRRLLLSALVGVLAAAVAVPVFALGRGDEPSAVGGGTSGIAVIDARRNEVVKSLPIALRPSDIVASDEGLWVASLEPSTVLHLDPATRKLLHEIPVREPPTSLTIGSGGIWVLGISQAGSGATLQRIDPTYGISTKSIRLNAMTYPGDEAAVAAGEGAVWVAPGGLGVLRLDAQGRLVRRLDTITCCPSRVAVGDGALWVADRVSRQVARIDLRTGLIRTVAVGDGPSGIAIGEGAVWVALSGDGAVTRLDRLTAAVKTTIPVGNSPTGITTGGGSVWVANSHDGTVSRIDPKRNDVVKVIDVGGSPQRLVYLDEEVWVSVQQSAGETAGLGEIVEFSSETSIDSLDPALAYVPIARSAFKGATSLSWQIEYATCAKLVNYPDRRGVSGSQLVPELAASLPKVSNRGKTYTFTIRKGFRFSPPSRERVTAATMKYSIERSLSPAIGGPALRGIVAPLHGRGGVLDDVGGAKEFGSGKAKHISGVVASGNRLTIKLTAPAPDLLARLAMPFFCAVPMNTPVARGVRTVPAAGPYYVKSYVPDQRIVLAQNPNYHGQRPHEIGEVRITLGEPKARSVASIESGRLDYSLDGVPAASSQRLYDRYGPGSAAAKAGKQRYFVNPTLQNFYLALNTSRAPFSSARLRRAVNYAVKRNALATLLTAFGIPSAATDQYLPPGMPGFRDAAVYPLAGNVRKALRLSRGRRVKALLYSCDGCAQADQLIQYHLGRIGIEVEVKTLPITLLTRKLGKRGEPFDLAVDAWSVNYVDPASFLNVLLSGKQIRPTQNFNIAYFDSPVYNRRLDAAMRLTGRKRFDAYGRLDVDLAKNAAPMVALVNLTRQDFFSARMGCQVYNPIYGMDIAALCLRK